MKEFQDLHIVYKVTAPSGNSYIGVSKHRLAVRRRQHEKLAKSGSTLPIHNAIKKYGNALTWTILAIVESRAHAMEFEKNFIKHFDTLKNGFNLTIGGDGVVGRKLSREEKRRLSIAHRNQVISAEARRAMSESRRGNKNWKFAGRMCTPRGIFQSYSEATKSLNLSRSTLSQRCHSKSETWKHWYLERNPK